MLKIRRSADRYHARHGWLDTYHTFSFADYYDPQHMHFGPLRVINEDRIEAGQGFGKHPHRDMEIITYLVSGTLEHQDSMGNKEQIRAGEVQHMSAGTGVTHAEYNPNPEEETHLLQIWIIPDRMGVKPRYGQKSFAAALEKEPLVLVASKDGRDGSIPIYQDADMFVARLREGGSLHFDLKPKRGAWLQIVKGTVSLHGEELKAGDGAAVTDEKVLEVVSRDKAEFILFDLPPFE